MTVREVLNLSPVASVAQVQAYVPPQANPLIDLPLHATERPVFTADLRAFHETLDVYSLGHYPDARALEGLLAARLKVAPTQVMVTAGADEALDRACRAMLGPGRALLTPTPTFEMIPYYARLTGAEVVEVPWPEGRLPTLAMVERLSPAVRLIAVVSPNNPTGSVAHADDIRRLAHAAPQALVLVDMAYVEFADHDMTAAVLALPNTVVVRTLSKAWGLPGLRIGYVAGQANLMQWLRAAGGPYSVARPSLALAHARLGNGEADMQRVVERVRTERKLLEALLRPLATQVVASQANFVLARFKDAVWLTQALHGLGIGVRAFPNQPQLSDARRITCPADDQAFARLRGALIAALAPQALLLDLDGVMADVSASYRQAVIQTAEAFGVTVSLADVAAAKAAGSANNDWQVTHRLLLERGVEPTLAAVTACFERLYQGTAEEPGLRRHETLLCEPKVLQALSKKLPLAVVTGRPRADAERFLQEMGILKFFRQVICMEDAPLKPDPAPVRLALERLGVQAAWMVGDTPDDIRAARGANVVPLGVIAPGDDAARTTAILHKAGAARVLSRLADIEALLP